MNSQLTIIEKSRLAECETIIERSMNSFYDMGVALREIRESKLYKEEFDTFEEYCQSKWSFSKTHCNRIISSSHTIDNLTPIGVAPKLESQTRPFIRINDPEIQRQAWKEVLKEHEETKEPITARKIENVVSKYCAPCVNQSIEFRRVFYLTPFYNNKLVEAMKGEKDSTFIRGIIEMYLDGQLVKKAV